MGLPNYSPSGTIKFGTVPWDNGYTNVRLYTDLTSQASGISSLMSVSSDNYSYIGRNRRIKVDIEADRLYHCNYCMYKNNSLTDGYIYCFITDVKYINDNTTEVEIETDVFQTYLWEVDWGIDSAYIERATVNTESGSAMYTTEKFSNFTYVYGDEQHYWFTDGAFIIMRTATIQQNDSLIQDFINPRGYYIDKIDGRIKSGIYQGADFLIYKCNTQHRDAMNELLTKFNQAGAIDSIVAIFAVPDFIAKQFVDDPAKWLADSYCEEPYSYNADLAVPWRGNTVDGYEPRNKKLLYYPYNFCRLTDYNGAISDLRFELMGEKCRIGIKYVISPTCKAIAVPVDYAGIDNVDLGIVVSCGALCSWNTSAYQTWLAQNTGTIANNIFQMFTNNIKSQGNALGSLINFDLGGAVSSSISGAVDTANRAGDLAASIIDAQALPVLYRGSLDINEMYGTGLQGVHTQRVQIKAEIAELIDAYFDKFGYAIGRIEPVDITSRPTWNYIKTIGAAPRSHRRGAGSSAPFSRGRGTPASALNIIRQSFDNGVTFWHTTDGFGDYGQYNGV